jgi:lysophospholipase L1-like esterase
MNMHLYLCRLFRPQPLSRAIAGAALVTLLFACGGGGGDSQSSQWVATWFAAQQNYNEIVPAYGPSFAISNQTVRQIVHTSYGGNQVRIKLSNLFGTGPATFSAVHVARSTGNGAIDVATDRTVTFGGTASVTLAAGTEQWSDSADLPFTTQSDLAISLFVQGSIPVATSHLVGQQNNYTASNNQVSAATMSGATASAFYFWLSEVDTSSTNKVKVVVAFGDSITDGAQSTVGANHRWPNFFDDRMQAAAGSVGEVSVVNAGISGNRWLHDLVGPSGQTRFARDVMGVSGATHTVIFLGINDIGFATPLPAQAVTSDQIVAAIGAAIAQAKSRQVKVFLATLMPYEGSANYSASGEAERQAVNVYIRSASGVDGVIDFDKVMQDPSNPASLLPAYNSGDHIHPNDAGYQAMANAINLSLFAN